MTKKEVKAFVDKSIHNERVSTHQVLIAINMAEDCKLYLDLGFSSMFAWLTGEYKYSESAAWRRISAARLLRNVPEASEKLQAGEVNLTTMAKTQSAIRKHEQITGDTVSKEDQAKLVEKIENKSGAETDQMLIELMPEIGSQIQQERKVLISPTETRITHNMTAEAMADLEWVKAFLSHSIPNGETGKIFARLLKEFRERNENKTIKNAAPRAASEKKSNGNKAADPSQVTAAAAKQRVEPTAEENPTSRHEENPTSRHINPKTPPQAPKPLSIPAMRRIALERANYRCEYQSPETGHVCGSNFLVQVDHIIPKAIGGADHLDNFRCLCAAHNRFMAEQVLGKTWANHWKSVRSPGTPYLVH